MGIPNHLTCLLRNMRVGQEATVRAKHGTIDWFEIGKGVHQCCILSSCLFNFYLVYIMQNNWLDESHAEIKIARRNINNFRYADDTTLMAESKEPLDEVKEENEKAGIKLISVQFNSSAVSNSLQPHRLQHAKPPCPSPTPRV